MNKKITYFVWIVICVTSMGGGGWDLGHFWTEGGGKKMPIFDGRHNRPLLLQLQFYVYSLLMKFGELC